MSEDAKKFLNSYGDFVTKVTSEPSLDQSSLDARMTFGLPYDATELLEYVGESKCWTISKT